MIKDLLRTNKVVLTIFVLIFLIGDNVLATWSIKLPPHKFAILLLGFLFVRKIKFAYKQMPHAIYLLCFLLIYTIFKIFTGGQAGNTMMGVTAILPVLVYIVFRTLEKSENVRAYKSLLYFSYVIECGIAILERLLHIHIFKWHEDSDTAVFDFDVTEFRSFGLFGHPLQNAVIIEVFILFILIYERNVRKKYIMAILGVSAIFCFNGRAAMVMSVCSVILYTLYWCKTAKVSLNVKLSLTFFFMLISGIMIYLYNKGLIGGRLSSMGLYDENSAGVRVDALNIFKYYNLSDFIIGISEKEVLLLKYRLGLIAVENFWLNWMLTYGVVFVIGMILFYIPVLKNIYKGKSLFVRFFTFVPFITLASTNPSLAVSIVPVTSFLLLSHIMPLANERKKS